MFESGFTTLFHLRGIPVRAHFSLVLGLLLVSGLRFAPGVWAAYLLLVIAHEYGHALLARRYQLQVLTIDLHALGGYCMHEGTSSRWQSSVIAWGGVLAQMVLFAGAWLCLRFVPIDDETGLEFLYVLVRANLWIVAINLIPLNGLDGALAWQLPRLWWQRRQRRALERRLRAPREKKKEQPVARTPVSPDSKLKLVRGADGDFRFEHSEEEEKQ